MDRHERETVFSAVIKSVGIRFACKGFVESIIVEVEIFLFSRKQSHFQILHLDSKFQLPLDCYLEVLFRFLERSPVSSEIHFQCQGTALAIFKKSQNSERELCRCLIVTVQGGGPVLRQGGTIGRPSKTEIRASITRKPFLRIVEI